MPYKNGGGDKPQLYSKNSGEYIRNPQCEHDEGVLVLSKLFGLNIQEKIAFPTYGIHDDDYCILFIKYCVNYDFPEIPDEKITKYLLVPQNSVDKAKFLNGLGFSLNNPEELYSAIIRGTEFKKKKPRLKAESFCINTETILYNKDKKKYSCITSWAVKPDFTLRFVTLIPEEYKDE